MVHTEYGREHWDLGGGEGHYALASNGSGKWSKGKSKGKWARVTALMMVNSFRADYKELTRGS